MLSNLIRHWFLITLAVCFWAGHQFASTVDVVSQWPYFRSGIVFAVMMATGLSLRADTIGRSVTRPAAAIVAIGCNVLLVPLLAYPTQFFLPYETFGGLWVASLVPCTLASAAVWTRKAGGDDSIAILTTIVTNLACFVVVPAGLYWVLSNQSDLSASQQIAKLAATVVAPLVLAQWLRTVTVSGHVVADWADQRKREISVFAQCGILVMVVLGSSQSGLMMASATDTSDSESSFVGVGLLLGSVAGVHGVALLLAIGLARTLRIGRDQQIACGIAGSQKTLMVGLQIAIDCGVSVLPMLLYHASQLLIDTVVADRWKTRSEKLEKDSEKAQVARPLPLKIVSRF